MRLELAQTFTVDTAHPTVILYLIMIDYLRSKDFILLTVLSIFSIDDQLITTLGQIVSSGLTKFLNLPNW